MAQRARNRNRLVYLLGAYVLLQFFWWARLLVVQGAQLREARGEPAQALMELERLRYGPHAGDGGKVPRAWRQRFAATARAAREHKPSAGDPAAAVRSSA